MAFSVLAADLLEALRILNLSPSESGTPSSDFFLAIGDKTKVKLSVAGSVLAQVVVSGSGQWPTNKPFYIPRQLFSDWVNEAKRTGSQSPFEFSLKEKLIIVNGKRKTGYDAYSAINGYVDLPEVSGAKLELAPELIKFIDCATTCATSEKQNPSLGCVFISPEKDTVELLATNQPVIIRIKTKASLKEQIIFPVSMVDVLKAEGLRSLHWTDQSIVAKFGKGTVWHPLLAEAKEGFPLDDMRSLVDGAGEEPVVFKVRLDKLTSVLSTLGNCLSSVRKDDWKVVVAGAKGSNVVQLTVRLSFCTLREEVECLPIKTTTKFTWPVDFILPVLSFLDKNMDAETVEVRLDKDGKASYLSCGPVELVLSAEEQK